MTHTLPECVVRLAELRRQYAEQSATIKAAREAFDATIAGDIALSNLTKQALEATEAEVRGLAQITYDRDQNAKPTPGISIVQEKVYTINETAAFAWAKETKLCLLPEALDVKALKKLATVQPLPFVLISEMPSVRIASDLDKALAVVETQAAA